MNVATALNRKYVRYTGVMLYSLGKHQTEHIDAYLLHSELLPEDIDTLYSFLNGLDVSLHPVSIDRTLFSDRLPRNDQWRLETYYRLLLFDLLPEQVDRILYLDVDSIVLDDISDFYHMDFDGNDLISCVNACGKPSPESYSAKQQQMFAPMFTKGYQYFCAGVTLFSVSSLRKKVSFQTYLDAMMEWDYQMAAPDQDLLNYVHWQQVGYVDPYRYDLFARIAHNDGMTYTDVKDTCAILHFAGDKPWASSNVHYDIEQLWWDYARESSPPPTYMSLLEDFLASSFRDYTRVERYIYHLEEENHALQDNLQKAMRLLRKVSGT